MTKRARILALAPNAWDGQWMNRQQILSRLAATHHIVYSTGPWFTWSRSTAEFRAASVRGTFELRDGVWVDRPPKYILRWPKMKLWDRASIRAAASRWRRHLDRLGTGALVAYIFHPSYAPYARILRADLLVYSPFDLFSRTPGWGMLEAEQEQWLLEHADLIFAVSKETRAVLAERTTKPVHWIPNGVDADAFMVAGSLPVPSDMQAIPHPRIGYVGSINRKVDLPLIARLAEREPGWHFVLIGPQFGHDEVTEAAERKCRELPNVHFLAPRSKEMLPATMGALDVGLMCYRTGVGTWVDYGYPLKLHEYLATGLPVVSADLPAVREFEHLIDIASTVDDWHSALQRILAGAARGSVDERRAEAARNTWDRRASRVAALLDEALEAT